ncbi:MAG TPA: hypothetical protein VLV45_04230 [Gemmatimonadales bacterium]|nr:hypothetical protein [Gemmatimonadales bacterium]
MNSRRKVFITVGAFLGIAAVATAVDYRQIATWSAPEKRPIGARSAAAIAADSTFWRTFHGAQYDHIQDAIETLARAYVATPNDPTTAAHLGWLHIWRIAEHARMASTPAAIIEDMALARRYFSDAVALDPSDARKLGFLASATMGEGSIEGNERLTRQGYFLMQDAIKAWPAFNLFTAGYVFSTQPAQSKQFREGLEWQWRNLDVCAREHVDRSHPEASAYLARVTDQRACLNTWIAPHNAEGFYLNMGDMLVKSGDWRGAQVTYANAKLTPGYATWPFARVLEDRIRNAEANVSRFSGNDPDPPSGMMNGSAFSCMGCHQQ